MLLEAIARHLRLSEQEDPAAAGDRGARLGVEHRRGVVVVVPR